mmetsp:Transcript_113283/g.353117  ORF Transcript_113283/g.353117 Transcript_113283/m.353117 type:complete len:289 (+) Transcript_113283:103-969(+)
MDGEDIPLAAGARLTAEELDAAEGLGRAGTGLLHEICLDKLSKLHIREMPFCDGVTGSTGGQVWPASIALARLLLREPSLIDGKCVVELGSGCGLASVVAARSARRVLVTDGDGDAVANSRANLLLNAAFWRGGDAAEVFVQEMLWEDMAKGWPQSARVDVIMGSDITYQNNQGHMLTKVAEQILRPGGLFILVSDASRGGVHFLRDAMSAAGFDVEGSECEDENGQFCICLCRRAESRKAGWGSWYLPEQWEEYHHPSLDTPYYWNTETGEIVWSLAETGAVQVEAA